MESTTNPMSNISSSEAMLVWRELNVYAKNKKNGNHLKRIINNVSGSVRTGTLIAVMGSRFAIFL